jgi:hypothetical protein
MAMKLTWVLMAALATAACAMPGADGAGGMAAQAGVKVWKSRGAIQCGSKGTPPEQMARELEAAGITVLAHACGSDGRLYPAMCGKPDGKINIFTIPAAQLERAAALQFRPLASLPDAHETACP